MEDLKTVIDHAPKAERLSSRVERKIRFDNLTERQKNLLAASGAGVAGVSVGVVAMALMGFNTPNQESEDAMDSYVRAVEGSEDIEVTIYTDAPFSDCVNDKMSFTEAFKSARSDVGAGGFFEWHGNIYNTYVKEEWDEMTSDEKADFFSSLDKNYLPGNEGDEQEILNIVNDFDVDLGFDDTEDIVIVDDGQDSFEIIDDDIVIIVDVIDGYSYESPIVIVDDLLDDLDVDFDVDLDVGDLI